MTVGLMTVMTKMCGPNVKVLQLYNCHISADALKVLVKAKFVNVENISLGSTSVSLGNNNIGDRALNYLQAANWPRLTKLELCTIHIY